MLDEWTSGEGQDTRPPSRTLSEGGEPAAPTADDRPRTHTIGGSAEPQGVVRRGPLVDVSFQAAPLREVFRLLSDAAGINVIVDDGVTGTVSIDLRDVRPLDAMRAIAEAHGAVLETSGQTVLVRPAP